MPGCGEAEVEVFNRPPQQYADMDTASGDPGSWLKPDVSLTHPDQRIDRFYIGAPLIAFEVVERAVRLNEKVLAYLANGAAEVWLIYPDQRNALVYDGSAAVRNETRSIHTSLLPGIDIPLGEIL